MEQEEKTPHIERADAAFAAQRFDEALQAYLDALDDDPSLAWAQSRIGAILAQRGDLEGAEVALNHAIELAPNLPQAHSNLGNVFFARGEYEAALGKYKQAVALSPSTPVFHENLHAAYKKLGKLSNAVGELKQAHRLQRESTRTEAKERFSETQTNVKRRLGCGASTLLLLVLSAVALWLMI